MEPAGRVVDAVREHAGVLLRGAASVVSASGLRERHGQLAGEVDVAVEQPRETPCPAGRRGTRPRDALHLAEPRHRCQPAGLEDDDGLGVRRGDRGDQRVAVARRGRASAGRRTRPACSSRRRRRRPRTRPPRRPPRGSAPLSYVTDAPTCAARAVIASSGATGFGHGVRAAVRRSCRRPRRTPSPALIAVVGIDRRGCWRPSDR